VIEALSHYYLAALCGTAELQLLLAKHDDCSALLVRRGIRRR